MQGASDSEHEDVLSFWFGELDAEGLADEAHAKRWFTKSAAFDRELEQRFGALHGAIAGKQREHWLDSPRPCLAYVIVLDQFSRNMFRDTSRMFAYDSQALAAAGHALARGWDREMRCDERCFLYMPFMHSERLEDQERSVSLFRALRDELGGKARERVQGSLAYAEAHRDIVRRFGRFPHRNALLGRESSAEELAFLEQPGSSF